MKYEWNCIIWKNCSGSLFIFKIRNERRMKETLHEEKETSISCMNFIIYMKENGFLFLF